MNPYEIIIKPLLTEKNQKAKDDNHTLAFMVNKRANKIEVKRAVEMLFNTHVERVRVINVFGKIKRVGRYEGRRPSWKKALVTLRKGEKMVEYFEGL